MSQATTARPVVLIGAGGLVGRRVCRAWHQAGVPFLRVGRSGDLVWNLIGAPPPCPAAHGASVVVLAGVTPVTGGDLSENTRLAQAGVDAARRWNAAHVFVTSSSSIYGPTPRDPVGEDAPADPRGAYAEAKLAMEHATRAPDVTALRLANVAGAAQPFLAIDAGAARLDAFPDAPDAPMRSFIGPVALARCLASLAAAVAHGRALPPVLNVAARRPIPMLDIFRAAGVDPARIPAPQGAVAYANLDTARLAGFWDVPEQSADALWSEVRATDMSPP
ncbi:NAD-dependent epimerase/dehydratase family protein [Maribius pontilimi]|uniref:NAD-dependent epimerase/dehydratase family protein n=1 Tax=Palleronia pontilimi TaxID=1964209 RepID=A0A934IFY3_9RHOB|nr:NAD-dependent epimerase/dehydratase family protein [Palleronia pontilimi]MBJ3762715.1 NAD-dependent epimerase/dehydratase family protein [Palleronia pontilimi]